MLKIRGLQKDFDGFVATNNIDFDLDVNAVHAIIGPNGAGKSTFFNLITGHLVPTKGSIVFEGQSITGMSPHRIVKRGLARSFQNSNIFPRMSVFENVQVAIIADNNEQLNMFRIGARLHRDETTELLHLVGLDDNALEIAGELSHGKQKQLELALSLACNPRVLLLDEPTAGMSTQESMEMMPLIKNITMVRGLTLLFTEHDMTFVFGMADRISVLHHGEFIAHGDPEAVRNDPEVRRVYLGDGSYAST